MNPPRAPDRSGSDAVDSGISAVMPAYNAERTLARSIETVLQQTHRNLELVVVDDGSTDATPMIAQDFARRDARVRVVRVSNGGVAAARNHGIAAARHELIAPVDADDLWHPSKLEKQLTTLLAAAPETAFVYAHFRVIDEADGVVRSCPAYSPRGQVVCRHLLFNFVGNGSSMLMRRTAALKVGGYDVSLQARGAEGCEDLLLQLRMANRYPVEVVPEYLVGYRRRRDSMSSDGYRMSRSYVMAYEDFRLEQRRVPESTFAWGEAPFIVDQAIAAVRAGALRQAVSMSADALYRDPLGSLTHLGTRVVGHANTARTALRERLVTRRVIQRRSFYAYDPHEDMVKWNPNWLASRRARTLERLDRELFQD